MTRMSLQRVRQAELYFANLEFGVKNGENNKKLVKSSSNSAND